MKGLKEGKPVSETSHYAKQRTVTMSENDTGRTIDGTKVYKQISDHVFEKQILDEMLPRSPRVSRFDQMT
jgi:hypothetical protein